MSKVITFSRFFPATHKEKGKPTYFVEKFWKGLQTIGYSEPCYFFDELNGLGNIISGEDYNHATPKLHTIRAGNRFKVGDYFSPRVWSGMPYKSKQIIIAEDIKVLQVYDISFCQKDEHLQIGEHTFYPSGYEEMISKLAKNDGLSIEQFKNWFNKPFTGQIICWSNSEGVSGGFKDLSQQVHLLFSYSKLIFLLNIGVKFRITFLAFKEPKVISEFALPDFDFVCISSCII